MQRSLYRSLLLKALKDFPGVVLVGPRQCGKTTLAKSLKGIYFDLETEQDKIRLDAEWNEITGQKKIIILDEAQEYPALFPRLRAEIDRQRKKKGRFLLLGSIAPSLMKEVSESLAGRLRLIEMTPFLEFELPEKQRAPLWLYGGYPDGGILRKRDFPQWEESYLQLLSQRDFPKWGLPSKPANTLRLFRMLAVLHGQQWNASEVAASLGLSYHTVNHYLEFLEQTYLIRCLRPYFTNLKKRLVKSPKVYWRDSGLHHFLMGAPKSEKELLCQPWVGASWEGWVIEQILSHLKIWQKTDQPYYFRTHDGKEADLILEKGDQRVVIEIKLTTLPTSGMIESLNEVGDLLKADLRLLISKTARTIEAKNYFSTDLVGALKVLKNRN